MYSNLVERICLFLGDGWAIVDEPHSDGTCVTLRYGTWSRLYGFSHRGREDACRGLVHTWFVNPVFECRSSACLPLVSGSVEELELKLTLAGFGPETTSKTKKEPLTVTGKLIQYCVFHEGDMNEKL